MNFFKRESGPSSSASVTTTAQRETPAPERSGGKQATTYIAAGSRMEGEITGSAEVLVDGEFHGQLRLESAVVVGREGRIQGEIQARSVRIEGRVIGNVQALERVEVVSSASLEGDISAERVSVAEGAFFKGNVQMGSGKKPDAVAKSPASPPATGGASGPSAAAPSAPGSNSAASSSASSGDGMLADAQESDSGKDKGDSQSGGSQAGGNQGGGNPSGNSGSSKRKGGR